MKKTVSKRVLSGIKPTGALHLGSYLGAMKHWPDNQRVGKETFFFLADLHALNARLNPSELRGFSYDLVAWLLVMGVDPQKSVIFAQSQVPAHTEMAWILNNYTTMGELNRMTQYKDKAQKFGSEGQLVALYGYPVLMAADILLYDADEVPVGDDQIQHVELTRDIASRFNNIYGPHLKLPNFIKQESASRVMMLDNPSSKMSKSEGGEGCIYLDDSTEVIHKKIMHSVTDSLGEIRYDRKEQPGIANLLEILSSLTGKPVNQIVDQYSGSGYGGLKVAVSEAVIEALGVLQGEFAKVRGDESALDEVLTAGRARAQAVADKKLVEIKRLIGLLT
ncbi:tryptophan--tRNA ligase [Candidatus Saccharibacteria bacterium]|nr:tryptophan--tRNA ligase [Candidatus Saccharibacteria bacterium]